MARPEEEIEWDFVKECKKLGLDAHKFTVPFKKGAPDRVLFLPRGKTLFVEFKRPNGGVLSIHQMQFIDQLYDIGHKVIVADNWEEPLEIVKRYLREK